MSLYHVVFLFLLLCAVLEHLNGKSIRILYRLEKVVLLLFLCLRYGQGSDYLGYAWDYYNYHIIDSLSRANIIRLAESTIHGEIGWKVLCSFCNGVGISFEVFAALLSVITIVLFFKFITRYCENKSLSLFISFHTLYLVYFFSAIRQGLVISIFLAVLLPLYQQRKNTKYIIIVLLLSLIHTGALFYLLLFAFNTKSVKKFFSHGRNHVLIILMFWVLGFLLSSGLLSGLINSIIPGFASYFSNPVISIATIFERVVSFAICYYCIHVFKIRSNNDENEKMNSYLLMETTGLALYGLFFFSPLLSSRANIFFKSIETLIIGNCINKFGKSRSILFLGIVLVCTVMYVHNINNFISWDHYVSTVNFWNYPYVSLFDKDEIWRYISSIYRSYRN